MIDQQKRMNGVVFSFVAGALIGCLVGMPGYAPLKSWFANMHAMIPEWEEDTGEWTAYKIRHTLLSAETVATVWVLAWGVAGAGVRISLAKLDAVKEHAADRARRFGEDAGRFFAAQQTYEKAPEGGHQNAADLNAGLVKAATDLKAARAELKFPEFQKQVDELLSRQDDTSK
jgi:hypothetical protein